MHLIQGVSGRAGAALGRAARRCWLLRDAGAPALCPVSALLVLIQIPGRYFIDKLLDFGKSGCVTYE